MASQDLKEVSNKKVFTVEVREQIPSNRMEFPIQSTIGLRIKIRIFQFFFGILSFSFAVSFSSNRGFKMSSDLFFHVNAVLSSCYTVMEMILTKNRQTNSLQRRTDFIISMLLTFLWISAATAWSSEVTMTSSYYRQTDVSVYLGFVTAFLWMMYCFVVFFEIHGQEMQQEIKKLVNIISFKSIRQFVWTSFTHKLIFLCHCSLFTDDFRTWLVDDKQLD